VETQTFGCTLKRIREGARFSDRPYVSQSRLAEWAGFDHSYVSRLETGSRMPTRDAVHRLADALQATAGERDEMLMRAGFVAPDAPEVEAFRALPAELQRAALEFIETVRAA
jgi:transcriptional regulator with XRE-family HTH domain